MTDKALNEKFTAFLRPMHLAALAANTCVAMNEQRSFASLRYTQSVTRAAVLAPKQSLTDAMKPFLKDKEVVDQAKLPDELLGANEDRVKAFIASGVPLYKVDIPPNSILFTPAGFAAASKKKESDIYGCAVSVVPGSTPPAECEVQFGLRQAAYGKHVRDTFGWLLSTISDTDSAQAKVWHHMVDIMSDKVDA